MRPLVLADLDGVPSRRAPSVDVVAREMLAAGAHGVELSVAAGPSGPVLHAGRPRHGTRRRSRAGERTRADGYGEGPTLTGLFEESAPGSVISVAIGDDHTAAAVIDEARGHERLGDLWLRAPDLTLLSRLGEAFGGEMHLVHMTERLQSSAYEREAATLSRAGVSGIRLPWEAWSLGLTALFEKFGVRGQGGGVRETRHLDRLVAAGVEVASVAHLDRLPELLAHPSGSPSGRGV